MQQLKRVAKNTGILYIRMILTVFISLYATRLVLGELGAENFGVYAVLLSSIAVFGFLNGAVTSSTQRFIAFGNLEKNIENKKQTFSVSLVLHIFTAFVFVLLLEIVSIFLFDGFLNLPKNSIMIAEKIFQFMIMGNFFVIISNPYSAVILAHENMLVVAIIGIVEALLKLAIALLIIYVDYDKLLFYGFSMPFISFILFLITALYCHFKYKETTLMLIKYFDFKEIKSITRFTGWSFLGIGSTIVTNQGQGILLNMFFGTTANTAYGIAAQVNGQLTVLSKILLKALNPAISKTEGSGDRNTMIKLSMMGSKISFYLLMIVIVPVLIEMPFIFNLWLKEVPEFVIIFCRLLLIRTLIEQIFIPIISSVMAVGKIKNLNIHFSLLCLLPLPITYYLFNLGLPAYVMYLLYVIYSIFWGLIILNQAQKNCDLNLKVFYSQVVIPCATILILNLLITYLPSIFLEQDFLRIIITLILSLGSIIILVWIFGLQRNERENIILNLKGFFKKLM